MIRITNTPANATAAHAALAALEALTLDAWVPVPGKDVFMRRHQCGWQVALGVRKTDGKVYPFTEVTYPAMCAGLAGFLG